MKFFIFLILIQYSIIACKSNKNIDIYGTWTSIDIVDATGMNVSDKVVFNKDGNFEVTMFSNSDSIIKHIKGTYEIAKNYKTLKIITNGMTFEHRIIEIDEKIMKIETQQGIKMRMKKIK